MKYSDFVQKNIDTDISSHAILSAQNNSLREQIDSIYSFYRDVSWDEVGKEQGLENPDNFFGRKGFESRRVREGVFERVQYEDQRVHSRPSQQEKQDGYGEWT